MISPRKSKIYFFFKKPVILRHRTKLKKFIEGIFRKEAKKLGSLNFVFCSDKELLAINREYLSHDYYTDIITFELSEKGQPIEGEVYISIDRVAENAQTLNVSLTRELHRVIFHGVLHLCGYSDKKKIQQELMRKREDYFISLYF